MYKFKKLLSSLVAITMVFTMSTTVMAADVGIADSEAVVTCVQTVTEEPIENFDELLALALEQSSSATFSTDSEQKLVAKQLLETRTYSDSSVEKDYSMTQFLLPAGVYAIDVPGYKEVSNGAYGAAFTCRANFTSRIEDGAVKNTVRLNSVTTTVQNYGTSIAAKSGMIRYILNGSSRSTNFICSSTFNPQSYSLTCTDTNFYYVNGQYPGDGNMVFDTEVYTFDGNSVYALQQITDYDL